MTLVTLDSADEGTAFIEMVKARSAIFAPGLHIGAVTPILLSKTEYFWITSGKKVDFTLNWAPGHPDNSGSRENCLLLVATSSSAFFYDNECTRISPSYDFICQNKVYDSMTTTTVQTTAITTAAQPIGTTITPDVRLVQPGFSVLGSYGGCKGFFVFDT